MNHRLAAIVTLGGAALIVAGLLIADFSSVSVSAVLIDGGVAVALFAGLLVLERRMTGAVEAAAKTTAKATVEQETRDLRERVVRLENLDQAQAEARNERKRADERSIERLNTEELTTDVVGSPLVDAYHEGLFADDRTFRVRTSDHADCHVLYMVPLKDPTHVPMMFFDFEPIEDADGLFVMDDGTRIQMPALGPTTCGFSITDDAGKMAGDLEAALRRANKPTNGFSLRYALEQIATSVEVMHRAREAESRSLRLEGRLRLLINGDWAITDAGLEALAEPRCFKISYKYWGPAAGSLPTAVQLSDDMRFRDDESWLEARHWMTEREHLKLEYGAPT